MIKNDDVKYSGKFLSFVEREYVDDYGKTRKYEFVRRNKDHDRPEAVIVLAKHTNGKFVLTKEFRPAINKIEVSMPAGLIDSGESHLDAATREFKEETGMNIVRVIEVSPRLYSSAGLTDESVIFMLAQCDGEVSKEFQEENESIEVLFVGVEDIYSLINDAFADKIAIGKNTWTAFSIILMSS